MASTADAFASFRFSTDDLPEKDRIPFWREVVGRSVARLEVEPLDCEGPFRCEARGWSAPGLTVLSANAVPYATRRTVELLAADERDDIVLVTASGGMFASQGGRDATVATGQGILISNACCGVVNFLSAAPNVSVVVPRAILAPMVTDVDSAFISGLRPDNDGFRLLTGYLDLLNTGAAPSTPEACRIFAAHVCDLLAATLGATKDAAEIANGRGISAARMRAIKNDIAENLTRDVSLAAIARRHRVSPRYVQKLFEGEGTSLSRYVLRQRIALVHRMLSSSRYVGRTIGEIAYSVGFCDLSTFNREFRRHYGMTPSDVRAAGQN